MINLENHFCCFKHIKFIKIKDFEALKDGFTMRSVVCKVNNPNCFT